MDERITETVQTYNDVADTFVTVNEDSLEFVRQYLEAFLRHLNGKCVLDVGCGPGRDSRYFSEHGLDAVGMDLSARFVQMAKENAPDAHFALADMRHLPFMAEGFDGLWVCASLLHIPRGEAAATVAGFRRLLKPGGLLFVAVKQGEGEKMVLAPHLAGRERFFSYHTREGLRELLTDAGFTIIEEIANKTEWATWINVFARAV